MRKINLLIKATKLLCDSGVCPKSPRVFHYWWDLVKYCHKKGYLYLVVSGEEIEVAAIGYRINKIDKNTGLKIPNKQSGDILYVPVLCSVSNDKYKLMKLLSFYCENENVTKIAYRWRGKKDDLRVHDLRRSHVRA